MQRINRRILWGVGVSGFLLILAPVFGAFEAHVINVTAQIQSGVIAVAPAEILFGAVFPQEALDQEFSVTLSEEILSEPIETQYAATVVSSAQALRKNGTVVLTDRSDPGEALGSPETSGNPFDSPVVNGTFFSLGFGGNVVLGFDDFIVNEPGDDITVYEVTGGSSYPEEKVVVEASQDGLAWVGLGTILRDDSVDLGALPWAKFVRLTDVSDSGLFEATADAYDLDAVEATAKKHLGEVDYVVRQKPKCGLPVPDTDPVEYSDFSLATEDGEEFVCEDDGYVPLPLLCPYLSKHEITFDPEDPEENDSEGIGAFHGLPGPWTLATTLATEVLGELSEPLGDLEDRWVLDLRVPCFDNQCAQDWPEFVRTESGDDGINPDDYKASPAFEHELYGCDIWVEVTDFQ